MLQLNFYVYHYKIVKISYDNKYISKEHLILFMKSEVLRTFLKTTKKKYSMNNVLNFREKLIIQTLNFICSVKKYLTLQTIFKE